MKADDFLQLSIYKAKNPDGRMESFCAAGYLCLINLMSDLQTALRNLRILFIGDVMGRSGRAAIARYAPQLREKWTLDFIIVNGENAAGVSASQNQSARKCSHVAWIASHLATTPSISERR